MENLSFTTHGIQLLLEKLDPAKAPGPDHIPTKVIKLCANVIAPVLQIIYSQTLEHAVLPQDWLSDNITVMLIDNNMIILKISTNVRSTTYNNSLLLSNYLT